MRRQFRILFLALTCGTVFLFLGRIIIAPSTAKPNYSFPTVVPLPEWKFLESQPLGEFADQHSKLVAGRRYQYRQQDLPLEIEMRYLAPADGDVQRYVRESFALPYSPTIRELEGVGFYSSLVYQQRVYLSACINSRGGTTVTFRQFVRNQNRYHLGWERTLPWLLGQQSFSDPRCLWAQLSMPLKDTARESQQVLEQAWETWYQWWQPRFPK